MKTKSLVLGAAAALTLGMLTAPAVGNAAGTDDPNVLIVGGHPATEQYDWMASLQLNGQHTCGASLVDDDWALTAAHCVQGTAPDSLSLRVGSPDRTSGGTEVGVAQSVVHPAYATQNPNGDLALVRLDHPVSQTPVTIADSSGPAGTQSRIIGWGLTCPVNGCGDPPVRLQELDTQVVDDGQCSLSAIDDPTEICTGGQQLLANACYGDSGGPQLEGQPGHWELTGITSRLGSPVPICGTAPSIYTDATAYKDWINQVTG